MRLAAILAILLPAQAPDAASTQQQVVAAERAWSDAFLRHDLAALERLLAEDNVGIDGRGVVTDRAAEIEEARPPRAGSTAPVLVGERLSDVRVRLFGEVAVLTAVNTARFASSAGEETVRYRRTTVWVRRDGRWQCVSFHGSRILA